MVDNNTVQKFLEEIQMEIENVVSYIDFSPIGNTMDVIVIGPIIISMDGI